MTKEEQDKIVEENMWLVEYVAKKYKNQADWSDMVSAGRYGLVRGIKKYDPEKGKPSTYLIHWVRAEIMKCLYEDRNVHLPWNRINKYMKERNKNQQYIPSIFKDGIYPRFEFSLNMEYDDDGYPSDVSKRDSDRSSLEFKSSLSSDFINNVEKKENNDHIIHVFETTNLSQIERKIIVHRFGLYGETEKTLKEVGSIIGYTPMGVQKIEKRALKKLHNNKELDLLR